MSQIEELLKYGKTDQLWQLCCGFLDLDIEQFMKIQKQLMLEQIELLKESPLGQKVMHGARPRTIEEFRKQVKLTTYSNYCPELLEKNESVLPSKPVLWVQTSGRSGEYPCKWIPMSEDFWREAGLNFAAIAILGSCKDKYHIRLKSGFKLLHAAAQSPCLTGAIAHNLEHLGFTFFPPLDESEELAFEDRVNKGFKMALSEGMDGFFGLAGILVAMGEKIKRGAGSTDLKKLASDPKVLVRFAGAKIKSKLAGRKMLPKDLFSLKVIASMGTDSVIYKERIRELWGRAPLDVYGNSETAVIATQTWDYNDMVFFPNLNFLEFIPEAEHSKGLRNPKYQPKTVLLDEVKAGQKYELVITNLHGGALVRYRLGDMIRITTLSNEKLGIHLPQMIFERRADDLIDLGFMRLTERVIWMALEKASVPYVGWTAKKEIYGEQSKLHLYIELENDAMKEQDIAVAVYQNIKHMEDGLYIYKDLDSLENLIDFSPIEVTSLPRGVFASYKTQKQAEGVSFAHLRPPHLNPSDGVLSQLGV
jgi:hypothetical protein